MLLSIDLGSVPDWISAGLSALAIYFVYWQVNRQIKNEKILKTEFSRPIFLFNLIKGYHDNIKTYIPSDDTKILHDLNEVSEPIGEKVIRYKADRSAPMFKHLNRIFYISNPSTQPMLFVKLDMVFEDNRNEIFWIDRINENESIQILPDYFIKKIKEGKRVKWIDSSFGIQNIKLFFTTALNEKFEYLYSYKDKKLNLDDYQKLTSEEENYYELYSFDENPYILFKA